MEDVPQPSLTPYAVGDRVQIYIDIADPDSQYHGDVCEVIEVRTDDLSSETGRTTDAYKYTLQEVDTDEKLPIAFRHHDIVPAKEHQ